jgi:hypothetical protein
LERPYDGWSRGTAALKTCGPLDGIHHLAYFTRCLDLHTMTNTELIEAIEGLPDEGKFFHREYVNQMQWDDTDIATYADLKKFVADFKALEVSLDEANEQLMARCEQ